jgi:hypothetical protein
MLKFLINKGHTLCKNLEDYTFGQYYFMLMLERNEIIAEKENTAAKKGGVYISGSESIKSIKSKMRLLKR